MKTFVAANFGLLSLIVFWTLTGAGWPGSAVALAFALAALTCGSRLRSASVRSLEIAALAFFALLGVARLAGWAWAMDYAVMASFIGLGLFSLGGAALRKPWTAEYSR